LHFDARYCDVPLIPKDYSLIFQLVDMFSKVEFIIVIGPVGRWGHGKECDVFVVFNEPTYLENYDGRRFLENYDGRRFLNKFASLYSIDFFTFFSTSLSCVVTSTITGISKQFPELNRLLASFQLFQKVTKGNF